MAIATPVPDHSSTGAARSWLGRPSITMTLTSCITLLVLVAVGSVWWIGVLSNPVIEDPTPL